MAHVPGYVITTENGRVIKRQVPDIDQAKLRQIATILGVTEVPTTEGITKILVGRLKIDLS
jgi:hypothetical protein